MAVVTKRHGVRAVRPAEPSEGSHEPGGALRWLLNRYRVRLMIRSVGRGAEILRSVVVRPRKLHRFHIVSSERNTGHFARRCLDSVSSQRYPKSRVTHVLIDDASTDDSHQQISAWLEAHPGHRVRYIRRDVRRGMLANNLDGFAVSEPGSIGIELNGDDWLPDPGVLAFLNLVYQDPEVWMTYNTLRQVDGDMPFLLPPARHTRRSRSWRRAPWVTSHLHTFRIELFWSLPPEQLVDPATGRPWDMAQDMAVYLALLELGGHHARHLWRVTCCYNPHADSDHVRDRAGQLEVEARIRAMPRCAPLLELPSRRRLDPAAGIPDGDP